MTTSKSPLTGTPIGPLWPGVVDGFLDVGGRAVRALSAPSRAGRDAEPQLLVHGLGGSSVTWAEVVSGLSETGPVVAVDLPGFGRTRADDDPVTIDGYVDFVVQVADALGWSTFALHGNSMGGLISTLLAAKHPERVSSLVLVSPALPPANPLCFLVPSVPTLGFVVPMTVSSVAAVGLGAVGASTSTLVARRNRAMLGLIFGDPDDVSPDLLALMARDFRDLDPHESAGRRRALSRATRSIAVLWADPRRVWQAIHDVQAPTLVLGGTADALVAARTLRSVLARRRDWTGHVLPRRRHALMMEAPGEYLDLVEEWRAASMAA